MNTNPPEADFVAWCLGGNLFFVSGGSGLNRKQQYNHPDQDYKVCQVCFVSSKDPGPESPALVHPAGVIGVITFAGSD